MSNDTDAAQSRFDSEHALELIHEFLQKYIVLHREAKRAIVAMDEVLWYEDAVDQSTDLTGAMGRLRIAREELHMLLNAQSRDLTRAAAQRFLMDNGVNPRRKRS